MSNTRRAEKGTPLRQERFASAPEFERGLLANLIAKRCELLDHAEDRALIWWIQSRSWQEGGLQKLVAEIIALFPDRIATPSMLKFGIKPGQIYNLEKIKSARSEFHDYSPLPGETIFPCKGDYREPNISEWLDDEEIEELEKAARKEAEELPSSYPVSVLQEKCIEAAKGNLANDISNLCLDPKWQIEAFSAWYFPALVKTLREIMSAEICDRRARAIVTELGHQVHETLDYCEQGRCMVLIDGLARTGKTHSAKLWCQLHPGSSRYIQCPSTNDDIAFFRAIAKAIGVSANLNAKAQELRNRIEEAVQSGQLTLVFDEAHFLWPQGNFREKMPARISWIMTALVNQGVPVALLTTPQFIRTQKAMVKNSAWTDEQFTGRIGHYQKLPDKLSRADLEAVARHHLPDGCDKSIAALTLYAEGSAKYLAAIDSAVTRARFLASKAGRAKVSALDVANAIQGSVIPSDNALAAALAEPKKQSRARAISAPVQPACNAPERDVETPLQAPRGNRPATPGREQFTTEATPAADRVRGNLTAVE